MPGNGIDEDCDGVDGSTATFDLNGGLIDIYPNPTLGQLYVTSTLTNLNYKLYDTNGKLIKEGIMRGGLLDISDLNPNLYLLELYQTGSKERIIDRIIKL